MKVLVIGLGAMGAMYGWTLSEAGHEVSHYVREEKIPILLNKTVEIRVTDRRKRRYRSRNKSYAYHLVSGYAASDAYDYILAPVRSHQVDPILTDLQARAGNAVVVILSTLWMHKTALEQALAGRYILGFPHHGGTLEQQMLRGFLTPSMSLGEPDGANSTRLRKAASLFETAGYRPRTRNAMYDWLQTHFAINTALMGSAKLAGNIRTFGKFARLLETLKTQRDAVNLCESLGIRTASHEDAVNLHQPLIWQLLKLKILMLIPTVRQMIETQVRNANQEISFMAERINQTLSTELPVKFPRLEKLCCKLLTN